MAFVLLHRHRPFVKNWFFKTSSRQWELNSQPSFTRQPHKTTSPPSSIEICLCVKHPPSQMSWQWKNLNMKRNNTGCARIQSYVSEPLAFHFESQTKALMFSWSHCGTLCVSLYLFRQLAQPLIFRRPQHATDRIMDLSPAGFTGGALSCKYGPCPQAR